MANGNVITTHGLTKRYGPSITAVDALDLEVHRGEVFGFLGPNGAGKTTTLRMLLGLIRPTAGSAVVAEHRPGDPEGLRRIGSLVESPAFYPYLSGRENLKIVSDYAGISHTRVDAALEEVDLADRSKDRFGTYSMGMKQRLAVAAALIKDPELMILDEPTNGLDPQGVVEMRALIRRLGSGNRTVMLSSHLLNEVQQISDRVRVTPVDAARRQLDRMLGAAAVTAVDGTLRLAVDPGKAADINEALVGAGIKVSELRAVERTLEEVFLTLTGEAA